VRIVQRVAGRVGIKLGITTLLIVLLGWTAKYAMKFPIHWQIAHITGPISV
jgi:hypothetical protein